MQITKREVIFSVVIISLMICLGLWVHGIIEDSMINDLEVYTKALKIDEVDMFNYACDTKVGNILVYDNAKTLDPVSLPELSNSYAVVAKYSEKYTEHRTEEEYRDSDGNIHTRTKITYSWDSWFFGNEEKRATKIFYMGDTFDISLFHLNPSIRLNLTEKTVNKNAKGTISNDYIYEDNRVVFPFVGDVRYYYCVIPTEFTGTMFATCDLNGLENNKTEFFYGETIGKVLEEKEKGITTFSVVFAIIWIILICAVVVGFFYLDNNWLESSNRGYRKRRFRNTNFSFNRRTFKV